MTGWVMDGVSPSRFYTTLPAPLRDFMSCYSRRAKRGHLFLLGHRSGGITFANSTHSIRTNLWEPFSLIPASASVLPLFLIASTPARSEGNGTALHCGNGC